MLDEVDFRPFEQFSVPGATYKPRAFWLEGNARIAMTIYGEIYNQQLWVEEVCRGMSRIDDAANIWGTLTNFVGERVGELRRRRHFTHM